MFEADLWFWVTVGWSPINYEKFIRNDVDPFSTRFLFWPVYMIPDCASTFTPKVGKCNFKIDGK